MLPLFMCLMNMNKKSQLRRASIAIRGGKTAIAGIKNEEVEGISNKKKQEIRVISHFL